MTDRLLGYIDASGDCWLWTGNLGNHGYGRIWMDGRSWYAHVAVWRRLVGDIPAGLELDHLCRVPRCVNPDHLEPVTHRTNTLRSPTSMAGRNARRSHCHAGHALDGWRRNGRTLNRYCLTCNRERVRRYKERVA